MLKPLFLLILWIPRQILSYLKLIWSRKRYPPGPFPLPVIGSLWRRFDTSITEMTFRKLAKEYGNIYSMWGGSYHCIVLCGYQAMKEVLIDHSEVFVDRPITPYILTTTEGKGIAFSNGHTWQQQRRFGVVTMRKLGLGKKGMEAQIQEEAQELVEFFAETKGQPFDPSLSIMKSFSNVICAAALGHQFSIEDKNFQELIEAISFLLNFAGSTPYLFYEAFPYIMKHLPGLHQTALSFVEKMLLFVKEEIKQHKENQSQHEPQDFIDFYLLQMEKRKNDPDSTYDEDNLAQSIVDFFIGGTDTTVGSLQWALLFMANNLDIQDKVYKEMEDAFTPSYTICYEDRKKLPYTNAVIHELMRNKYSVLFGLPRESVKDIYLNGFLFPKGSIILGDLRSVLFDPEEWETPEEFNPNHFLDKEGNFVTRKAFLPFGAEPNQTVMEVQMTGRKEGKRRRLMGEKYPIVFHGINGGTRIFIFNRNDLSQQLMQFCKIQRARACLGELLAKMELFNIFTRLLRAFRVEPPEGVKISEKSVIGTTVHPTPFKICALPRVREP